MDALRRRLPDFEIGVSGVERGGEGLDQAAGDECPLAVSLRPIQPVQFVIH